MAAVGAGSAPPPPSGMTSELLVHGVGGVDRVAADVEVVDEPGRRERVGLEQLAGRDVVHADLLRRPAGDPQAPLVVEMEPDRHEPGVRRVIDEEALLAGQHVDGPDVAVPERPGVQVPRVVGLDALGLEAIGQVDAGGQVGIHWPDGRGGWRQHEAQGQGERGEKSEATGERHGGLQRPWLAASWSGSNDQPALGGEPADRLWECGVRSRRAPHQPARSPLIDTSRAPQDRSEQTELLRVVAHPYRPRRVWLVPGRPPARGSFSDSSESPPVYARLGGTSLAGTSPNRMQKRYGELPRDRLVPTPKRHYIRISTGSTVSRSPRSCCRRRTSSRAGSARR